MIAPSGVSKVGEQWITLWVIGCSLQTACDCNYITNIENWIWAKEKNNKGENNNVWREQMECWRLESAAQRNVTHAINQGCVNWECLLNYSFIPEFELRKQTGRRNPSQIKPGIKKACSSSTFAYLLCVILIRKRKFTWQSWVQHF